MTSFYLIIILITVVTLGEYWRVSTMLQRQAKKYDYEELYMEWRLSKLRIEALGAYCVLIAFHSILYTCLSLKW